MPAREVRVNWNKKIRQLHRWLSIAFTLAVLVNFGAMGLGKEPPVWVYLIALLPLFSLLITGLYLFVLPYTAKGKLRANAD
jgi:quinol-cytochrome oxidoreductase complex cytochrome b subunit